MCLLPGLPVCARAANRLRLRRLRYHGEPVDVRHLRERGLRAVQDAARRQPLQADGARILARVRDAECKQTC
jgi:hypothetical protein